MLSWSHLLQSIEKEMIEHHWACLLRYFWVEGFKFDCFTLNSWMTVALSFSTEKGYNFFEQVKQYHTGLLLINKLYDGCWLCYTCCESISHSYHILELYGFWQQDLDRFHMEMQLAFIRRCSNLQFSQECLVVWLEERKKSLEENFGKNVV